MQTEKEIQEMKPDKWCGDFELFLKFEFAQLHNNGKPIEEPQKILAISKYNSGRWVNTTKWSYPITQLTDDECWLKIPRGTSANSIKLIKRKRDHLSQPESR